MIDISILEKLDAPMQSLTSTTSSTTRTKFLDHKELPMKCDTDVDIDSVINDNDNTVKCGFCAKFIIKCSGASNDEEHLYIFASNLIEDDDPSDETLANFWYLCSKCFNKDVRFCQFSSQFYFYDELVQLNDNVVINSEYTDIIKTYCALSSEKKSEYIEMCGITPKIVITKHQLTNET